MWMLYVAQRVGGVCAVACNKPTGWSTVKALLSGITDLLLTRKLSKEESC